MERRIKSPETGRPIKVGGPTYNRLMKEGKLLPKAKERSLAKTLKSLPATRKARKGKLEKQRSKAVEGRGSRTRGWAAAAPQKGRERYELMRLCGAACFLKPATREFPICSALREKQGCKVDCRGVTAARVRAAQYKHRVTEAKAKKLERRYKCGALSSSGASPKRKNQTKK